MKLKITPYWVICILLHFIVMSLSAQQVTVKNIPLLDKLPVKAIHRIFQDSDGYMWYGTFNGLCRYDGYDIEVFRSDLFTPGILKDNYITYIVEDHKKKIWFGTMKGLYILDKETYQIKEVDIKGIVNGNIFTLNVTADGSIWVSVAGTLYQLYEDGSVANQYDMHFDGISQCVYFVYEDKDGNLLVSVTDNGMFRLNKAHNAFEPYFHHSEYRMIERIIWDEVHNCYWLGTWQKGIVRFNPDASSSEEWYTPQLLPVDIANRSTGDVFHMVQDDIFHHLWVTTDRDLFVFRITEKGALKQVDTSSFLASGNKMLYEIYKDREGKLWVSAFDSESFVVDIRDNAVNHFPLLNLRKRLRANPVITSLCQDSGGVFWLAQERYGLCLYDLKTDKMTHYSDCKQVGNIPLWGMESLIASSMPNHIWGIPIASPYVVGISRQNMDMKEEVFLDLRSVSTPDVRVQALFESKDGCLWIGCNTGLFLYRASERKIEVYPGLEASVKAITQTGDGKVWIAISGKGVGSIDSQNRLQVFPNPKDFVCMDAETDGKLWLGTGLGEILMFDSQKKEYSDCSIACGMQGDFINHIVVDAYNHVWIVTNQMLKEYNPRNGAYRCYGTSNPDSLLGRFMPNAVCYNREDGEIFFGGINGIIAISPSQELESIPEQVKVFITDVKTMGKSVRKNMLAKSFISLSPEERNLEINFSSLAFHDLEQIRYAYRLSGVDKDWVTLEAGLNSAVYSNLGKGTYTFSVKATDKNGLWSNRVTEITICREPAYYETSWAYVLYVILGLSIVCIIVYLYLMRMRQTNDKRLMDSMVQMKLRYFTNVSHELLTPLTVLSCLAAEIAYSNEEEHKRVNLMQINIRRLKRLLQQILDLRKMENHQMCLSVSYGSISDFVKNICEDCFDLVMRNKRLDFTYPIEGENIKGYYDGDKLDKIISNLLSNACKYTPEGKSVSLSLATREIDGHTNLVIKVCDKGVGIALKEQEKIFTRFYNNPFSKMGPSNGIGLSLTKELVELHHGTINVESKLGKGSVFVVEIPIDKECYTTEERVDSQELRMLALSGEDDVEEEQRSETLLLVEDDKELLQSMKNIFAKTYRVVTAENGKQAWEYVKEHNVDIIISDIMMPEMDGTELCRLVKNNFSTSHVIVVLLTARISIENEIVSYEVGADDYVSKPFEPDVLNVRLKNLLSKREFMRKNFRKNPSVGMLSELKFSSMDEQLMEKAILIVEKNLSNSAFDVAFLAGELGMSRSTLSRKLKGITGQTPLDFIKEIKMKHACRMLENKMMTIAEVVVALGYNDHKYFTSSFKETYGMTPSEFQKQVLNKTDES